SWHGLSIMVPQARSRGTIFRLWFRKPVLAVRSSDYGSASPFLWNDLSIMVPQDSSYGTVFRLWFHKFFYKHQIIKIFSAKTIYPFFKMSMRGFLVQNLINLYFLFAKRPKTTDFCSLC